jgi:hypothetical protein
MRGALTAFLVAAAVLTVSCTARRTIPTGYYDEYAGPAVAARFTSREFHFLNADSVAYVYASDNVGSSRYGKAKYRIAKNKLRLRFDGISPPSSSLRVTTTQASGDSLTLTCRVTVTSRYGDRQIPGVNFGVYDAVGKNISGTATAGDGTAKLKIARSPGPRRVHFSYIGWQPLERPLEDADASFDVLLQLDPGEVYNAGKEITFVIDDISDNQLVLKRGKDRVVFVKK